MTEKCPRDCKEIEHFEQCLSDLKKNTVRNKEMADVKLTLYGPDGKGGLTADVAAVEKSKVSWAKLGMIVLALLTLFATAHWRQSDIRADQLDKAQKERRTNETHIQTYSIKQDVILDNQNEFKEQLKANKLERDKDREILHGRITKVQEELKSSENRILKAIKAISK